MDGGGEAQGGETVRQKEYASSEMMNSAEVIAGEPMT